MLGSHTFLTLRFKDWENFVLILLIDSTVPNFMIEKCPREGRGVKMEDLAQPLPIPPPPLVTNQTKIPCPNP